jgi:hypothetical protein
VGSSESTFLYAKIKGAIAPRNYFLLCNSPI